MKYVFVGNYVPQNVFEKISSATPSTNNVQANYIKMLAEAYGINNVSVVTCNLGTKKLFDSNIRKVPEQTYFTDYGVKITTVSFNPSRLIQNISLVTNAFRLLKKKRKDCVEKTTYIINNHYYFFALPVFLVKRKHDVVITILNEGFDVRFSPGHQQSKKDNLINYINGKLLNKNDGLITFCKQTVDDYAPSVKSVSLLYACTYDENEYGKVICASNCKTILYAGLLDACYGLDLVIKAMEYLPNNYRLIICGGGKADTIKYVKNAVENDSRIEYKGMLPRNEVLKLERAADVLLLIRVMNSISTKYIAKYYQPSKLPEYLLSRTPIVATDIEAIPFEMKKYLHLVQADSHSIANKIIDICEKNNELATEIANKGFEFALNNCSLTKQKEQMLEFIRVINYRKENRS